MLTGIGLLGIYSAMLEGGDSSEAVATVAMQSLWLLVSLGVMAAVTWPSYLRVGRYSYPLFLLSLAALVLLLVARFVGGFPGLIEPRHGAYSWFLIPGTRNTLQPSELAKIAFIMALAMWLSQRRDRERPRNLVIPFLMALLPTVLVLRQPDLGTAVVFMPVLLLMLVAAGAKLRHLTIVIGVSLLLVPLLYLKIDPYQQRRIDSWLLSGPVEQFRLNRLGDAGDRHLTDPQKQAMIDSLCRSKPVHVYLAADYAKWWTGRNLSWLFGSNTMRADGYYARPYESPMAGIGGDEPLDKQFRAANRFVEKTLAGIGYQQFQGKIAIGSGGLTGAGFARGSQTQGGFVDMAQNDFIFAVIAEDWGFVGSLMVMALYALIIVFGVDVGLSTNEPYGKLLAVGVVALIAWQAFLNIAICVGLMPVTGIPLPLVSHGGSSLVSAYLAIGLLCNVGLRRYVLNEPSRL
jgi:rod shape determining protein RodA